MANTPSRPFMSCYSLPLVDFDLNPVATILGKTEIGDTTMIVVDSFTVPLRGLTIQPCYLLLKRMSENEFAVTEYGQQTHVMSKVSP